MSRYTHPLGGRGVAGKERPRWDGSRKTPVVSAAGAREGAPSLQRGSKITFCVAVVVVKLMRRLLIRMSFAANGEGGRTRTSGSGFGDRQCGHFAYTLIFKDQ
jgi:hypothetical protein